MTGSDGRIGAAVRSLVRRVRPGSTLGPGVLAEGLRFLAGDQSGFGGVAEFGEQGQR